MSGLPNRLTSPAIQPLRVLVATLALFVIANIVFALANPLVENLMLFNRVLPGFERFPYPRAVGKTFSREGIKDLDFLFASHMISAADKPADEYRIILIGDSSAWGAYLQREQTAAERINRAGLRSCDSRRVVVYNLAYPGLSGIKDLMILSEAVGSFHPDMILWSFTLNALSRRGEVGEMFEGANYERLQALEESSGYDLGSRERAPLQRTFLDRTLYGRRGELNLLLRLHWFDLKSISIGTDHLTLPEETEARQEPAGTADNFRGFGPGDDLEKILDFDLLFAASRLAGSIPLVYFNEPIYIEANNPVRYNRLHPRWLYDQYRDTLRRLSGENSWFYVDMWDALPPSEFTGVFHRTAVGEAQVTEELIPILQAKVCNQ